MQGQQRMSGGAGDNFQAPGVLEFREGGDQVFFIREIGAASFREAPVIQMRELVERFVPMRAMRFFFGEVDEFIEVPHVAVLQQRVEEHGAQRRREGEGEPRFHAVALPALHHLEQGNVGLGDGLEEPGFLQKLLVFGMPDERQMRVEDEGEVALHFD